jgi:hypothetical protein
VNLYYGKSTFAIALSFHVQTGLIFLPWPITGTLKEIHVLLSRELNPTGGSFSKRVSFNVRLNGTALFNSSNWLTIHQFEKSVSKTGLNIAGSLGDRLHLDVTEFTGNSNKPGCFTTLVAVIDDGLDYGSN